MTNYQPLFKKWGMSIVSPVFTRFSLKEHKAFYFFQGQRFYGHLQRQKK